MSLLKMAIKFHFLSVSFIITPVLNNYLIEYNFRATSIFNNIITLSIMKVKNQLVSLAMPCLGKLQTYNVRFKGTVLTITNSKRM